MMSSPTFFPLSRSALLMTVGDRIDVDLTYRIARFMELLDKESSPSILDIIPSYSTILVIYDQAVRSFVELEGLLAGLWNLVEDRPEALHSRTVAIPVVYGDDFGEDLGDVAAHTGLSPEEVIERHLAGRYTVGALGFAPGFAYLIGLAPELATPRKARPRTHVPAGSIGIGGEQTGTYALSTPGGWNLIGRTPLRLFRPEAGDPFVLRMGDQVRFERIGVEEFHRAEKGVREREVGNATGDIEVLAPGMQTSVQDLGRYGYGRFGISPNGAADRTSLIAANRRVGNPDSAAGLEITLTGPTLRFQRRTEFVLTGADLGAHLNGLPLPLGRTQGLMPGDELAFAGVQGAGARAYLAVSGGIEVPVVMGSCSTDLTAAIGGHGGRALRDGDRLHIGSLRRSGPIGSTASTPLGQPSHFDVMPGPQADRFDDRAWESLLSNSFVVSTSSNRVGLRLEGPEIHPIDSADIISEGIVTGAIQITGEGQPIVMLPGHATIGGYTKIATVIEEDLGSARAVEAGR
jgi:KipI family sensor histidine kinase inhibitor